MEKFISAKSATHTHTDCNVNEFYLLHQSQVKCVHKPMENVSGFRAFKWCRNTDGRLVVNRNGCIYNMSL